MLPRNAKLLLLALFFGGFVSVLAFRVWQVKRAKSIPFSPQSSSFASKPPSEALEGKIVLASGEVKKEPRDENEFEKVGVREEILQGEKLATGEESQATAEFPDFAKISLDSNSDIDFVSLLPANFLIYQGSGSVSYELLQDKNSVSVRTLHVLLTFASGEGQVTVDGQEIAAEVFFGKARLAMVDLENETHVWEVEEGQKVLIDDSERRVEIE